MSRVILTPSEARKIVLYAAGLSKPAQFGKGKEAVFKVINHLGFLQLDTQYVVERAHHHMLATRVPNYRPEWLEELQSEGRIFEFLTSDAGYMPTNDFRFSLPLKETFKARRKNMTVTEINLMNKVLDRISREGPLMAKDFENDRVVKSKGWWDWRPSKIALERLYLEGSLMTLRKKNFQKVYDLSYNAVPSDTDTTLPTAEEFARHIVHRSLHRLGIAYVKEIAWSARYVKDNGVRETIKRMADDGEIYPVEVDGLKGPLYMLPQYVKKKVTISGDAFILSPFDVLNVFRHRLKDFFNFDYQVECFVPKEKRKYGYFSLPILVGDVFVARMDSKADRKNGILNIHNIHIEPTKLTKPTIMKICDAVRSFAQFNQCEGIVVEKSNDKALAKVMRHELGGQ
ncbi:crosslink repair DNA glycosylase YcaQ family protein [Chryseolinea sp. H1M3-3]|uniref:winged helix-turn-helix domain-containing protein n=1 Tax=Chryseolinea sp. H1M3-3 TaxID=3034144 RepID=UPI0023ED16DB|nr:crosslink repair DNA glycosylase YcaQ family protein [Chryseolinea sp. H1M3-3]